MRGEQERKRERERRKEREKRKEKEKKERKRKEADCFFLSSLAFRQSELIGPRSRVRIFDEGLRFKRWDSSNFGLFLAFGLLFWANFGIVLCHVNGMGRACSWFKGLLPEQIWVEKLHLQEFPKCSWNPWARYCVDWRNSVASSVLQLRRTISFSSELPFVRS